MRVVLTGLWERGRPTNSPRKLRLAATSLSYKQPKTPRDLIQKTGTVQGIDGLAQKVVEELGTGHRRPP